MSAQTESRKALHEFLDLIREVDERWASSEWNLASDDDIVGAHRALMHLIEGGLQGNFEADAAHPQFRKIVEPWRKFTGDNGDAHYYDTPISADHEYRVRGRLAGAVYTSFTLEVGSETGAMGTGTAGVLNDTQFDVDEAGRFEIRFGGPPADRNWIEIPAGVSRITTRHYFEEEVCAGSDPKRQPMLEIEALDVNEPPPAPTDASVAAGIRRAAEFIKSRSLGMPPMADSDVPPFVSKIPNQFPKPIVPGAFGLAAFDAHYSMAPFVVGPDQALVIRGRWPDCRFANVCLWTRFQQTFDYPHRPVSRNRKQTTLEADGSFKMVLAHKDPGVPNWLDTEGRPFGIVFWRYMLAEGDVVTPVAELVPFEDVAVL